MFGAGEALLNKRYQTYPSKLPLLVYHGTEDNVRLLVLLLLNIFKCVFAVGHMV